MRTFSILTLGCKVNQYESQQIRELLAQSGLERVEPGEKPDLVVVNTCCVTKTASAKSRQYVRKCKKLSPEAVIVVCGCLTTVQIGELPAVTENLHYARSQKQLAAMLSRIVSGEATTSQGGNRQTCPYNTIRPQTSHEIKPKNTAEHNSNAYSIPSPSGNTPQNQKTTALITPPSDPTPAAQSMPMLSSFDGHTRAFLKVQDGCDGCCTYCIVPKTRPIVRSKPPETAIAEAQALVNAGHKEIVVTGIFLGAYGLDSVQRRNWPDDRNDNLADLIEQLAQIPGLARIRLSSLEPGDVTPRLLDVFRNHRNIMPHLHLSLQSGSDAVLERMRRQYDVDAFRRVVETIKTKLDRPAITTDIIVGFPGETDADFEKTVELAREVGFAKMHIFPFSARKGTAAAKMQDVVDPRVIKKRSQVLHGLNAELGKRFRELFIGESTEVLIEGNGSKLVGRSERYFTVFLPKTGAKARKNDLLKVKLTENTENGILGSVER